jgi:RNA-directed DNA polymerase
MSPVNYQLSGFLGEQVRRTVRKYSLRAYRRQRELKRRAKRTGKKPKALGNISRNRWNLDQQFNPFYVKTKIASLSHAIEAAIRNNSYAPRPSVDVRIPKDGGGHRWISIYTVPDAAIGTWLHRRLQGRNSSLLSESAFGYRSDKNANDAIRYIADAVADVPRLFVVEFDFAKFFDSIDHPYLLKILGKHFKIRPEEKAVLRGLLSGKSAVEAEYKKKVFKQRTKGIPQGNTISLFLANAVCHELDKALEGLGVKFARYADDIVIVTESYLKACDAANLILQWSKESKVQINYKKSEGISLLSPEGSGEIRSKKAIVFLGCEISPAGILPSEKRIRRLKSKLSLVIYQHLIQAPKKGTFNKTRIKVEVDWDLVTCVNEIRKILYGRVTEAQLTAGLDGGESLKPLRSHMSGFAMVEDPSRLRALDGWLVGTLERACAMRQALVSNLGVNPLHLGRKSIICGDWCKFKEFELNTRLPSSFRAWLYIRRYYQTLGMRALPALSYDYV